MHPGFTSRILLTTSLFCALTGCYDLNTRNTTYVRLNYETRSWLVDEDHKSSFEMVDSISSVNFSFDREWGGFHSAHISGSFIGKEITQYEEVVQYFQSERDEYFTLTAETKDYGPGDRLKVQLNETTFGLDLYFNMLQWARYEGLSKSKRFHDQRIEGDTINSIATYHTSISFLDQTFKSVYHFQLKDFIDSLAPDAITDIYIAKNIGLVGYGDLEGRFLVRK